MTLHEALFHLLLTTARKASSLTIILVSLKIQLNFKEEAGKRTNVWQSKT